MSTTPALPVPVTPFTKYDFDTAELNRIFTAIQGKLVVFHQPKFTSWLQSTKHDIENFPYVQKALNDISSMFRSRNSSVAFLWQQKRTIVQAHIDPQTLCAVNCILSGANGTLWYPNIGSYEYKIALIDTKRPHGIRTSNENRIIFKISFFDLTYEQAVARLLDI